jgi:hypothetical protein
MKRDDVRMASQPTAMTSASIRATNASTHVSSRSIRFTSEHRNVASTSNRFISPSIRVASRSTNVCPTSTNVPSKVTNARVDAIHVAAYSMAKRRSSKKMVDLLFDAQAALEATNLALGKQLGVSSRTISRWQMGQTALAPKYLAELAPLVYPRDKELAADMAAAAGTTLDALGVTKPAAPAPTGDELRRALDAVVLAAADAGDISPRAARPAIAAALRAVKDSGIAVDALIEALRPLT